MNVKQKSEQRASAAIVGALVKKGKSLKEIGDIIECGESFISRVKSGTRTFSFEHLLKLQQSIGKPLALILLDATEKDVCSDEMKEIRNSMKSSIESFNRVASDASPGKAVSMPSKGHMGGISGVKCKRVLTRGTKRKSQVCVGGIFEAKGHNMLIQLNKKKPRVRGRRLTGHGNAVKI